MISYVRSNISLVTFYFELTCLLKNPTTTSCNVQTYKMQKRNSQKRRDLVILSSLNVSTFQAPECTRRVLVRKKRALLNHRVQRPEQKRQMDSRYVWKITIYKLYSGVLRVVFVRVWIHTSFTSFTISISASHATTLCVTCGDFVVFWWKPTSSALPKSLGGNSSKLLFFREGPPAIW